MKRELSMNCFRSQGTERNKIGQALGAWPMPLNGVSPVVPSSRLVVLKEAAREAAN
jgi:hypothetical protein